MASMLLWVSFCAYRHFYLRHLSEVNEGGESQGTNSVILFKFHEFYLKDTKKKKKEKSILLSQTEKGGQTQKTLKVTRH